MTKNKKNIRIKILDYKFKIFLFLILLFIYYSKEIRNKIIYYSKDFKDKNGRVCLCTLGKEENKYIKEFILHYKNYGVDKIYLYDNNEINGENFEYVIRDFITNEFVEILNWRGKKK